MTKPTKLGFGNFKIWVEDPDNPGTYIAPCGFKEKSLTLSGQASETTDPSCDDPEAPQFVLRAMTSLSGQVDGSGVFNTSGYSVWRRLFLAGVSFGVRIEFDVSGANGGGYYEGDALLTNLGHSAQLGSEANKTQAAVTLMNDGAWDWTDAA